jgi:threo-3-hydroxy-L-aspartate ammonia-lyase
VPALPGSIDRERSRPEVLGIDDILSAARRLDGLVHVTPVLTSRTLDDLTGGAVFLKAENLQRAGAFKFRGAYNRISTLPPERLARGVVTYSSGNHAQAVALAASLLGADAVIVMPSDTPASKMAATRAYGAEVVLYDRYGEDREELGRRLAEERGASLVPPYEDPAVMAGQGTVALELLGEVKELDILIVPVGGGGLIAGCGTAARALDRRIRVIGVEPERGDDTRRSLEAGRRVRIPVPDTIADGLQASVPGALTFAVNRGLVDSIATVSDEEIVRAMRFLFERMKVVVEPSGAVGVAALLAGRIRVTGQRVGAILSGGNVGADRFRELLERFP